MAKKTKASNEEERGASSGGTGGGEAAAQPVEGDEVGQHQQGEGQHQQGETNLTVPTTTASSLVDVLRCVGGSLLDPSRFGLNIVVGLHTLKVDPELGSAWFRRYYTMK